MLVVAGSAGETTAVTLRRDEQVTLAQGIRRKDAPGYPATGLSKTKLYAAALERS